MSTTETSTPTFAERLGMSKVQRWMDFAAYGMALKIAVHKDGKLLVMENGEKHSDKLAKLGFAKFGDDWATTEIAFVPRAFTAVFPEAKLARDWRADDIVLDKSSEAMPGSPENFVMRSLTKRIAREIRKEPEKTAGVKIWFAEAALGDHTVHGFGLTPERAMQTLVDSWTAHAGRENEDVSLIARYRDSIAVNPAQLDKGFAKGMGDSHWYQGGLSGTDERFDEILAKVALVDENLGPKP